MSYTTLKELPKKIQAALPASAQKTYMDTFNLAHDAYEQIQPRDHTNVTPYEYAHKAAWAAVKAKYHKDKKTKKWTLISN